MAHGSRVTLDIDAYIEDFELTATRAAYQLEHLADKVEVRVSSSGEGVHIIAWFEEQLGKDAKRRLRRTLGDDAKRLELDKRRWRFRQTDNVLWTRKENGEADQDFDDIDDALDYIRDARDPRERLKYAVQKGLVV